MTDQEIRQLWIELNKRLDRIEQRLSRRSSYAPVEQGPSLFENIMPEPDLSLIDDVMGSVPGVSSVPAAEQAEQAERRRRNYVRVNKCEGRDKALIRLGTAAALMGMKCSQLRKLLRGCNLEVPFIPKGYHGKTQYYIRKSSMREVANFINDFKN